LFKCVAALKGATWALKPNNSGGSATKHPVLHRVWVEGSATCRSDLWAHRLTFESIVEAEATRLEDIDVLEEE
jgi:hypothetical protein